MNTKIDDSTIVAKLKSDDPDGLKLLYEKYSNGLKYYSIKNFKLRDDIAEDLSGETLITAYENIDNFNLRGKNGFKNWVFKILKNKIIDKFKRKEPEIIVSCEFDIDNADDESGHELFENIEEKKALEEYLSTGVREDERKKIIIDTIKEFNPAEQSDIWAYLNEINHKESAEHRKVNYDTYRKRISRTMMKFFKKIGAKTNQDGKKIYEKYKEQNR